MTRAMICAVILTVSTTIGCTNARYVHRSGEEGIIAIAANTDTWPDYNRTNAVKLIEAHVGKEYEIVEEREVVTGQITNNTRNTTREPGFNPATPFMPGVRQTTSSITQSKDMTEWQIHYRKVPLPGGTPVGSMRPIPTSPALPSSDVTQAGYDTPAPGGAASPSAVTPVVAPRPVSAQPPVPGADSPATFSPPAVLPPTPSAAPATSSPPPVVSRPRSVSPAAMSHTTIPSPGRAEPR